MGDPLPLDSQTYWVVHTLDGPRTVAINYQAVTDPVILLGLIADGDDQARQRLQSLIDEEE